MPTKSRRKISYRSTDAYGNQIPFLALQSKILNRINMPIGTEVEVKYEDGLIHISRILQNRFGGPSGSALNIR